MNTHRARALFVMNRVSTGIDIAHTNFSCLPFADKGDQLPKTVPVETKAAPTSGAALSKVLIDLVR
jgi:hypothetical protein